MAQFFVSCQLGHENLLRLEIENIWHMLIDLDGMPTRSRPEVVDVDKGGIEIECPLHLGLQLNYFLKTALRVLLRLEKFQARYFDQFEKELKKISQQVVTKYYDADCFHIEIDSSKSRLFHEKHLQECADKIFKTKKDVENKQNLFIRLYKDSVTVSIDTTGEHLHKRGYRQQQGAAPLRETLAATTLQYWLQDQSQNGINPLQSDKTVIFDPFCGAGTLLFEALSLHAPHLYRPMNFLNWKNRPGFFQSATWKKNFRWHQDILANEKFRTYGTEIDPITFEKFNNNVKTFSELFEMNIEERCQIKNQKAQDVLLTDFQGDDQVYIITNPPYGERLEDFGSEKILEKLFSNLSQVKGLLCLHPENWKWQELRRLSHVKFQIPFSNQGLDLKMTYFEKK